MAGGRFNWRRHLEATEYLLQIVILTSIGMFAIPIILVYLKHTPSESSGFTAHLRAFVNEPANLQAYIYTPLTALAFLLAFAIWPVMKILLPSVTKASNYRKMPQFLLGLAVVIISVIIALLGFTLATILWRLSSELSAFSFSDGFWIVHLISHIGIMFWVLRKVLDTS